MAGIWRYNVVYLLPLGCGIWWAMRMLFVATILKGSSQLQDPHLLLHSIGSPTWNYPFNLFYFCHQYMDIAGLYHLCFSHWFWPLFDCINMDLFSMVWRHITWLCISLGSLILLICWIILGSLFDSCLCFYSWWLSYVDKFPSWMVKRCWASAYDG